MSFSFTSNKRGFTMIELLVVIGIIGLLTAMVVGNMTGSKSKARDGKRISDLAQIQLAMEQFFNKCGEYPNALSVNGIAPCGAKLGDFISQIPASPSPSSYNYTTCSYGGQIIHYALYTTLENANSSIDGLTGFQCPSGSSMGGSAPTCNQGVNYCISPK